MIESAARLFLASLWVLGIGVGVGVVIVLPFSASIAFVRWLRHGSRPRGIARATENRCCNPRTDCPISRCQGDGAHRKGDDR